jgi:hypothetical protein
LKQTAPERDHQGVCPIVGSQLVHQVPDMKIDGYLSDGELIGNLFVAKPVANEPEHLQLSTGKAFFSQMFGEPRRNLRMDTPFAGMYGPDHSKQIVLWHALEKVRRSSFSKCLLNLTIRLSHGQHDNASVREFPTNGYQGIYATRSGKPLVHQGNVWPKPTVFSHCLRCVGRLASENHVFLGPNNSTEPGAKNRVVLDNQNLDGLENSQGDEPHPQEFAYLMSVGPLLRAQTWDL